jgi:hypothetical protein
MGQFEQAIYFWVNIARRLRTDSETRKNIENVWDWHMEGVDSPALSTMQNQQLKKAFEIFDKQNDEGIDTSEHQVCGYQIQNEYDGESLEMAISLT